MCRPARTAHTCCAITAPASSRSSRRPATRPRRRGPVSYDEISASQDALVNARDQLRLAEARYAQGLGSVIELGDAQVAVTAAAAQDVQARFNLSAARAQLMSALGVR